MAEIIIPFRSNWNFDKFNVFSQFLSSIRSEKSKKGGEHFSRCENHSGREVS